MPKKTIYQTDDRQGIKYFSNKPSFSSGFDVFIGDRIDEPKNLNKFRVIKKFKCKVTGALAGKYGYPEFFFTK